MRRSPSGCASSSPSTASRLPVSDALKQSLDLSMFFEYRAILLQGLTFNVLVFLCAASVALSVGLGAALLRINRFWPMRWIGTLHVEVFRNAPDYIMLVWVHFVLPLLIGMLLRRRVEFHPFVSAVIALGFVYSGYFAEQIGRASCRERRY